MLKRVIIKAKKVPSSCPGQVDFPEGQVTFLTYLPNGKGSGKPCAENTIILKQKNKLWHAHDCLGQAKFESVACPKRQAGIKLVFKLS